MSLLWLALFALGCTPRDPELVARETALLAWEKGVEQLGKGDAVAARASFQDARRARPDEALLLSWEAKAAADQGDLEAAIALLDEALASEPGLVEARYNRAAYRARDGDPEGAAEDLADALRSGLQLLPRDIREDPDFAPWVSHPAFVNVLPQEPLAVAVETPDGAVFLGSEFTVRLRIVGVGTDAIGVTPESVEGPIALVEVLEETLQSTDGPFCDLTWRFRTTGAGTVRMGPFHVYAGTRTVMADAVQIVAKAPPGKEESTAKSAPKLTTPRELFGHMKPPTARWSAGQGLIVAGRPGDRVEITPVPAGDMVRFELRNSGDPQWVLWQFAESAADVHVKVLRAGTTVYDAKPTL